jgi:hypothetical protein
VTEQADRLILMPAWRAKGTDDVVPGSSRIEADCGHVAWISPSGMQGVLWRGIGTVCAECVDLDDASGVGVLPNADVELVESLGAPQAFRLLDAVQQVDQEIRERRKGKGAG